MFKSAIVKTKPEYNVNFYFKNAFFDRVEVTSGNLIIHILTELNFGKKIRYGSNFQLLAKKIANDYCFTLKSYKALNEE